MNSSVPPTSAWPDFAIWFAVDKHGTSTWFGERPFPEANGMWFCKSSNAKWRIHKAGMPIDGVDWKDTLVSRAQMNRREASVVYRVAENDSDINEYVVVSKTDDSVVLLEEKYVHTTEISMELFNSLYADTVDGAIRKRWNYHFVQMSHCIDRSAAHRDAMMQIESVLAEMKNED